MSKTIWNRFTKFLLLFRHLPQHFKNELENLDIGRGKPTQKHKCQPVENSLSILRSPSHLEAASLQCSRYALLLCSSQDFQDVNFYQLKISTNGFQYEEK